MQYTETELARLIETVEKEFTTHLNKAEAHNANLSKSEGSASALVKAEDSAPPKKEKESKPKDKEAKAPESKEAAPKEDAPAAEGAPGQEGEGEAAPAEGQAAAPPQAGAPAAPGAPAPGAYDEEDMAQMLKMYQSMSREELMAHHDCVRQCLDAMGAQEAPAAPGAEQAAPPQAGAPAAAPAGLMGKSEIKDENPVLNSKPKDQGSHVHAEYQKNSGGKIGATGAPTKSPGAKSPASKVEGVQMNKSENATEVEMLKSELEAEKAKSADLKNSFDKATEVLTSLVKKVTVPQGKAITSLDVIAKSEGTQEVTQLSKSEVTEILKKKDFAKLTKSDRDAINSFYLDGSNFNTISHLLKN